MYVRGDEPRAEWSDDWTDAEQLTSYQEMVANSGRVTIEGNEITYEAYAANFAGYMSGWPDNDQTATFEMDGDLLVLTFASGRIFTLRRPN